MIDDSRLSRSRFLHGAAVLLALAAAPGASAQIVTVGGGVLLSDGPTQPVFEFHAETPPVGSWRVYGTLSWTDESIAPTFIAAAERPVFRNGDAYTGVGAGLIALEANDHEVDAMLVSSTVVPLPVPRTSFVLIASTLPFESFDWSVVAKISVAAFFGR